MTSVLRGTQVQPALGGPKVREAEQALADARLGNSDRPRRPRARRGVSGPAGRPCGSGQSPSRPRPKAASRSCLESVRNAMCVLVPRRPCTLLSRSAMTSASCSCRAPDHGDQVDVTGDRVDLGDAVELGDPLGHFGDAVDLAVDEHDCGDHDALSRRPRPGAAGSRGRLRQDAARSRRPRPGRPLRAPAGPVRARAPPQRAGPRPVELDQAHARRLEPAQDHLGLLGDRCGCGPGPRTTSAVVAQRVHVGHGSAPRGDTVPGEPPVPDDDELPTAGLGAGRDDLRDGGQRREPLGAGRAARPAPAAGRAARRVLVALLVGQRGRSARAAAVTTARASPARACAAPDDRGTPPTLGAPVQGAPHRPISASTHARLAGSGDSRWLHWRSGIASCMAAMASSAVRGSRTDRGRGRRRRVPRAPWTAAGTASSVSLSHMARSGNGNGGCSAACARRSAGARAPPPPVRWRRRSA